MKNYFTCGALAVCAAVSLLAAGCGSDDTSIACTPVITNSADEKVINNCNGHAIHNGDSVGAAGTGGGSGGAGGMGGGGEGGGGKEPAPLVCQSYADCAPLPGSVVCHFNDCVAGKCEAVESPDKSFCYADAFGAGSCFSGECKPPAPANCQSQESCSLWSDCGIPQDGQCWYPSCDAGCCVVHACP